ncbi:MAG: hypothetical protein A4E53_01469 [Pelotomaculum sp. PtaB.Bin104]|nr:MAG: hypothetical protein A4E53_01469 [Pelotomaculum sp. PtaB.Bin104]
MDKYIGVKVIEAEPAPSEKEVNGHHIGEMGYRVKYPDGYVSWSPKEAFEKAYMKIIPNPNLKSDVSISQQMVNDFIKEVHTSTVGDKTTLVRVVLVNGFELVEASACVDKENYSEEIGAEICLGKIKDRIWAFLGFLLQTGVGGVR